MTMNITALNMELAPYVTVDLPAEGDDFHKLVDEIQDYLFDMGSHSDLALDMAFGLNAEAKERIAQDPERKASTRDDIRKALWTLRDKVSFRHGETADAGYVDEALAKIAELTGLAE